jgi:hypothetical protein
MQLKLRQANVAITNANPRFFSEKTLAIISIIACVVGCADNSRKFERIFQFKPPGGIHFQENKQDWTGNSVFTANINKAQIKEIIEKSLLSGYSEWIPMKGRESYGQGNFFLENSIINPVIHSIKINARGDCRRLFIRNNGEFYAIVFYN